MTIWKAETETGKSRIKEDIDKVKPGLESKQRKQEANMFYGLKG